MENNDTQKEIHEDANLNITELGNKYGYEIETHTVVTEDEYVLKVHRIPQNGVNNNVVVFLMHGISDSSDSWILQGPGNALGYILADEGYDVWMGNARGNKHSNKHLKLNINDTEFWNYTWEEIGLYDLPAMLDYIGNFTGNSIYYIGHSQGTTNFFAMNSLIQYDKVKMMFAIAPAAWMEHAKTPLLEYYYYFGPLIFPYPISSAYFNKLLRFSCKYLTNGCTDIIQLIIGDNNEYFNATMLPIILGHFPTESSMLQIIHYSQLAQSGRFCRFDHGEEENELKYGQATPPDYDVGRVKVPVTIFYSNNDWLSDAADVDTLSQHLPNVRSINLVNGFNHFDFMYAGVAKDFVYAAIVQDIKQFEKDNSTKNIY